VGLPPEALRKNPLMPGKPHPTASEHQVCKEGGVLGRSQEINRKGCQHLNVKFSRSGTEFRPGELHSGFKGEKNWYLMRGEEEGKGGIMNRLGKGYLAINSICLRTMASSFAVKSCRKGDRYP